MADKKFTAYGEVSLKGAKIGSTLDCTGGFFKNLNKEDRLEPKKDEDKEVYALNITLATVDGDVRLNGCEVEGHILALEMKVHGDFKCEGASIVNSQGNHHAISIDRSTIGGSIFFRNSFRSFGQVRMIGTKIIADLDCSDGKFNIDKVCEKDMQCIALLASRAEISGNVFLAGDMAAGDTDGTFKTNGLINLSSATIGRDMIVGTHNANRSKSVFEAGGIAIQNSIVKGTLFLEPIRK